MPTVRFKELAAVFCFLSIETSSSICLADQCLLRDVTWHRDTRSSPVLVDARLTDDTFNIVAVAQRLAESLQNYCSHAFLYNSPKTPGQRIKTCFQREICRWHMPLAKKLVLTPLAYPSAALSHMRDLPVGESMFNLLSVM